MMKKLLALAAALMMAATAAQTILAEEPQADYIMTIPSNGAIAAPGLTSLGTVSIRSLRESIAALVTIVPIDGGRLTNREGSTVAYHISVESKTDKVTTVDADSGRYMAIYPTDGDVDVYVEINEDVWNKADPGDYSGTIEFRAEAINLNQLNQMP